MLDWLLTMKYRGYAKSTVPSILQLSKKQDFVQACGLIGAVQLRVHKFKQVCPLQRALVYVY